MYSHIINPKTNRKVLVNSKNGKDILLKYINILKGGAVLEDIKRWGDKAGKDIKQWGDKAGKDIKQWGDKAGKDVEIGLSDLGDIITNVCPKRYGDPTQFLNRGDNCGPNVEKKCCPNTVCQPNCAFGEVKGKDGKMYCRISKGGPPTDELSWKRCSIIKNHLGDTNIQFVTDPAKSIKKRSKEELELEKSRIAARKRVEDRKRKFFNRYKKNKKTKKRIPHILKEIMDRLIIELDNGKIGQEKAEDILYLEILNKDKVGTMSSTEAYNLLENEINRICLENDLSPDMKDTTQKMCHLKCFINNLLKEPINKIKLELQTNPKLFNKFWNNCS